VERDQSKTSTRRPRLIAAAVPVLFLSDRLYFIQVIFLFGILIVTSVVQMSVKSGNLGTTTAYCALVKFFLVMLKVFMKSFKQSGIV
jgi:hypothetical protein